MTPSRTRTASVDQKLESNLLLFPFIANRLGLSKPSDFARFSDVPEGRPEGEDNTSMFHALVSIPGRKVPVEKLREYDHNIQDYERELSSRRGERISLKYFQYLSVLFTEIFLDEYFKDPTKLLNEINEHLNSRGALVDTYSRRDLRKVAYWMATGSGKTLLLHINYWQFLKYNVGPNKLNIDNVILITQSAHLSDQHLQELTSSGIAAEIFQGRSGGYFPGYEEEQTKIKVIDIYKLKLPQDKQKESDKGVTIDVSFFGSENLVFVDEGHKGHASEDRKWKRIRQALATNGFTFEYSATFGQAITERNSEDFSEYSKSIIFDYSYKYFFADGYGKDFRIHYVSPDKFSPDVVDLVLTANLLAFFEQRRVYEAGKQGFQEYNIADPLWIFVGHKVQEDNSDLLTVISFLRRFVANKANWSVSVMRAILDGDSGLLDDQDRDIFALQNPEVNFTWLRSHRLDEVSLLRQILTDMFHVPKNSTPGKLHLVDIKNSAGEIALKLGDAEIFGVIDIGDKSGFLTLAREQQAEDLIVESDEFTTSLFKSIENVESKITLLIGAKKFIEGWNSWRVSCMGLLNVGKTEGAQIIQLFGRGVRLKGKDDCLKRSRSIPGAHPPFISVLETLNIFGIKASYLETFRKAIEREEVMYTNIPVPTHPLDPFPPDLSVLRLARPIEEFTRDRSFTFEPSNLRISVDLYPRVGEIASQGEGAMYQLAQQTMPPKKVSEDLLSIVDWEYVLFSLRRIKKEKGWHNVLIDEEGIKRILADQKYDLFCDNSLLAVRRYDDLARLNDIVLLILSKYLDRNYSRQRKAWERDNVELVPLQHDDEAILPSYTVRVRETDTSTFDSIASDRDSKRLYGDTTTSPIRNLYLGGHLFQPLLQKVGAEVLLVPEILNEGEAEFVTDLKEYLASTSSSITGESTYLLRNLSRGGGVGFFVEDSFYPDFILWVRSGQKQIVTFIDPKGLIFFPDLESPKLTLYKYLQDEVMPRLPSGDVSLNAFIVATTPLSTLKERYPNRELRSPSEYEEHHILFQYTRPMLKNPNYVSRLFEVLKREAVNRNPN